MPSRRPLDIYYSSVGGTCLGDGPEVIRRPDFICVRMIDRKKLAWQGVIHFMTCTCAGAPALVITGCEPRLEIDNAVDCEVLWREIKKYAVYLANKLKIGKVLQNANPTAYSNRPRLSRAIAADMKNHPVINISGQLRLGNYSFSSFHVIK